MYDQKWCLQLSKPRFHTSDNEGTPVLSSTAQISRRIEHIQIHLASGNAQDIDGMRSHRQTIQETLGMYAGNPFPILEADGRSYLNILYVGATCVKWIPPLIK